jgi:3-hydroxypropanoate dehydrogenase
MDLPVWKAPPRPEAVEEAWLNRLFLQARSFTRWQARPVPPHLLKRLYDLARMGPTAANSGPARFVFVTSEAGKARLLPHLSSANRPKAAEAPVCVIVGYDRDFVRNLPKLFPHSPGAPSWFADPSVAEESALKNSTLQTAYLILAARALDLDAGPLSGFDRAGIDAEFFAGTNITTNLLVNIGFGRVDGQHPRLPRLDFEEACDVV